MRLHKTCPLCDRKVPLTARGCRDCGVWFRIEFHRDAVNRVIAAVGFGAIGWLLTAGWGLLAGSPGNAAGAGNLSSALSLAPYAGLVIGALLGRPYRAVR
jgi:hypothetical protein